MVNNIYLLSMTKANIPIKLPPSGEVAIEGSSVVVFIGPNGAGKTRYGKSLSDLSGGNRIPALRSLAFEEKIRPRDSQTAKQEAVNKINQTRQSVWLQADEFNEMLAELKAEDDSSNSRLKKKIVEGGPTGGYVAPEETNLGRLCYIWQSVFPNRILDFSGHTPQVTATHQKETAVTYNANTMSDGERAAIYLIASVLRVPAGLIVVDEPEVHFHGLLARVFWDKIEEARPDCRFVYITHDIPFALSRRNVQIGIVESDLKARMIPTDAGIPPEIVQDILGAASLSLVANTIIFTEGSPGSLDEKIYGAWFETPGKISVQVSNCNAVREAVRVFGSNPQIINNAKFSGIVERDYHSDSFLKTLSTKPNLHVLIVNEIESLLCLRPVALAITEYRKMTAADFDKHYVQFEESVRSLFTGERLNKQILERVKADLSNRLMGLVQTDTIGNDTIVERTKLVADVNAAFLSIRAEEIFNEHSEILTTALHLSSEEFLKVFPGKDCLSLLLGELDIQKDDYVDLISNALSQPAGKVEPEFAALNSALINALEGHLPPR